MPAPTHWTVIGGHGLYGRQSFLMKIEEIVNLLSSVTTADYSFVQHLAEGNYEPTLLSQTQLPSGIAQLCATTSAACATSEFYFHEKRGPEVSAMFGPFRDKVQSVLRPRAPTLPLYMEAAPGLGKTTLAQATVRVLGQKTNDRVIYFHFNGSKDINGNTLAKRVANTTIEQEIKLLGDFGLFHPQTKEFAYRPHPKNPRRAVYQAIEQLPDKMFSEFVEHLNEFDGYLAPAKREEWFRDQLGMSTVLTRAGASLIGNWVLGHDGKPMQRDNVAVVFFIDECNQVEDQKAFATIVGIFCGQSSQTGNPFGQNHRSDWVQSLIEAGAFNRHKLLIAAGNDQGMTGGDAIMMDALQSRLLSHSVSLPRQMSDFSFRTVLASKMVEGVADSVSGFSPPSVRRFLENPGTYTVEADILKHSKEKVEGFIDGIIKFEERVRANLATSTASAVGSTLPKKLSDRQEYLQKYHELGVGNVISTRNAVNLMSQLMSLKLDQDPEVNKLRLKRMCLTAFASEDAAAAYPNHQVIKNWMDVDLNTGTLRPSSPPPGPRPFPPNPPNSPPLTQPPGPSQGQTAKANSIESIIDDFCATFPVDALLTRRLDEVKTGPSQAIKMLMTSLAGKGDDTGRFLQSFSQESEQLAKLHGDQRAVSKITALGGANQFQVFIVSYTGKGGSAVLPSRDAGGFIERLRKNPDRDNTVRSVNSSIVGAILLDCVKQKQVGPTTIPQLVVTDSRGDIVHQSIDLGGDQNWLPDLYNSGHGPNKMVMATRFAHLTLAAFKRNNVSSFGQLIEKGVVDFPEDLIQKSKPDTRQVNLSQWRTQIPFPPKHTLLVQSP